MKLWQRSRVVCVLAYFGCNEDYVFYFAKWLARCLQPNRRYKAKKIIAIYIRRTYIDFFCCWGKYGNHPFNGMRFISTPRLLRTDYPSNNGGSSENSILFGRIFFFHFLGRSFNLMIIKNNVPFHILMAGVILPFLPLWFANIWLDVLTSKSTRMHTAHGSISDSFLDAQSNICSINIEKGRHPKYGVYYYEYELSTWGSECIAFYELLSCLDFNHTTFSIVRATSEARTVIIYRSEQIN